MNRKEQNLYDTVVALQIKQLRINSDIKEITLADSIRVSIMVYEELESKGEFTLSQLKILCEKLGVNLLDFIKFNDDTVKKALELNLGEL
ncbi:MAG: hypothetical protein NTZ16_16425 [Verrucomicrobia bacterium]|nr:hypothetical protein [Verrucomicrobiota bacterium]